MEHEHVLTVHVELSAEQAWALAQLVKRMGFTDCRSLAQDEHQAYLMLQAVERVRRALAELGCSPR
jgi:hypothetical protein